MKRIFLTAATVFFSLSFVLAQQVKSDLLEKLEQGTNVQQQPLKGVTNGALRLFGEKDDLTTVIMIVPNGAEVEILEQGIEYHLVKYQENTGFLVASKVEITRQVVRQQEVQQQAVMQQQGVQQQRVNQQQGVQQEYQMNPENRLTYLEHKYGRNIASRIYAGKIWKGMTPEMVTDAWGEPDRVNRVTRKNVQMEEWIYRSTWLLMEQGKLMEWGPVTVRR
jgi:hypothetical protein